MEYSDILRKGESNKKENQKFLKSLKRRKPKDLDVVVKGFHEETFENIDCLACANCCKTTSPGMHDKDVDRLAKYLRVKPAELVRDYMELDPDGEYVFRSAPCPFLGPDNYCSVYSARPLACREYPHTNRKRFYQVLNLTAKNLSICPAVVRIVDKLKETY